MVILVVEGKVSFYILCNTGRNEEFYLRLSLIFFASINDNTKRCYLLRPSYLPNVETRVKCDVLFRKTTQKWENRENVAWKTELVRCATNDVPILHIFQNLPWHKKRFQPLRVIVSHITDSCKRAEILYHLKPWKQWIDQLGRLQGVFLLLIYTLFFGYNTRYTVKFSIF